MTNDRTPHPAQPPPASAPTCFDGRASAVLVLVEEPPNVVAADILELSRGGCTASCDGAVNEGADGMLSIGLDGDYISRPVRVNAVTPDGVVSLIFTPIPNMDPRWADLS